MSPSAQPVALVTGASRGIGRAIAVRLAREGYAAVVNYHSNRAAADEVVQEIATAGGHAVAVQADVGSSADRQRMVAETLAEFGRIDVLVNNAGITSVGRKDLLDATEESWDAVFATNLKGPFFLAQQVARACPEQRPRDLLAVGPGVDDLAPKVDCDRPGGQPRRDDLTTGDAAGSFGSRDGGGVGPGHRERPCLTGAGRQVAHGSDAGCRLR